MYTHAPEGYPCPFCLIVQDSLKSTNPEIVCQDDEITAFMSLHNWPNNLGHVLVIPNDHFENIYDLPVQLGSRIYQCARAVALAMKSAYGCAGITTRQHNEPAGGQEIWHYHLHVIPRYPGDEFYQTRLVLVEAGLRRENARKLRAYLEKWNFTISKG